MPHEQTNPTPRTLEQKIIDATCTYYGCTFAELKSFTKRNERKIAIYLLRKEAMLQMWKIGRTFGYGDHSGPSRLVEEIDSTKDIYAPIRHDIDNIMTIVRTLV
jgi:chromosomal replication initiation ATPase DnaA